MSMKNYPAGKVHKFSLSIIVIIRIFNFSLSMIDGWMNVHLYCFPFCLAVCDISVVFNCLFRKKYFKLR